MKRNIIIKILSALAITTAALGFAACGTQKTVEIAKPDSTVSVQAAYLTATDLGYNGTVEQFTAEISAKSNGNLSVKEVVMNAAGELIVEFTDGTKINLGVIDIACVHTYSDWTEEVLPTCTSIGYSVRTCQKCGDTDYLVAEAKGHTIENYTFNQSCHEFICADCGFIVKEHSLNNTTCSVCGYELDYTLGLNYMFDEETQSYAVTGSYECRNDKEIIVPSVYKNYPVTEIGERAFQSSSSEKIILPDTIIKIGDSAFEHARIKSIDIPESVTEIGERAFYLCPMLEEIVIPQGVTEIKKQAFQANLNVTSISLPEGLKVIGDYAFAINRKLESLTIPDSVEVIGDKAFAQAFLIKDLGIPASVKEIGANAFMSCDQLETVIFKGDDVALGVGVFVGCDALNDVTLPKNLTQISAGTFSGCKALKSIEIPESVTYIDRQAFQSCGLTSIKIPDLVTGIGVSAFANCFTLTEIELGNGIETLGNNAFYECQSLENIVLPQSLKSIGSGAFSTCTKLKSIVLPEGITNIGKNCFFNCTSLTEITIPQSVTSIGEGAFFNCEITAIDFTGTKAQWKAIEKSSGWMTEDNIITDLTVNCSDGVWEYIW